MFSHFSPAFLYEPAMAARVLWLIFGRLIFFVLIVLGGWWWVPTGTPELFDKAPYGAGFFLPVVAVLTALYLLWLRFERTLLWQIRTQFLVDVLIVTWIVLETGDVISPYVTLYIIVIGLAGFFLGKTDAILVAGACTVCFTALPMLIDQSLIYSIYGQVGQSRAVQTIAFNDIAFLIVGLLAARIAERRRIGDELKQAEANFANLSVLHERILESINSGLITTDLQGKIYAFNRAAEEITGIEAMDALGKNIFTVFDDELRGPIKACLSDANTDHFSPHMYEAGLRSQDRDAENVRHVTMSCTVLPLIAHTGQVTGLIIAFQDTTQLRSMEDAMRRSDRLAAVGRMAAGLAHEIRNPLGSMSSALQFLSSKAEPDDDDAALMAVILRESDRLNSIITDFLAYAKPPAIDAAYRVNGQVDVGAAINDCLALLRHDPAVQEGHIFEFASPAEPVIMQIDETPVKQILWNLAQNSIQAMPGGGRLRVELDQPGPQVVRVVVSDTGSGIGAEEIENIFEPFYSGGSGTGLGLSIVHRMVAERGGRIDVKSEPGNGTTVTVELPK